MKRTKAFTLVELMCSLGLAGSVVTVGLYKIDSSHIIETTKVAVNKANAAQLNTAYQQGVITGRFNPVARDADSLIAQMFSLGMISEFDFKGGYVFKDGFFYPVAGFSPKTGFPELPVPVIGELAVATR